ncbi:Late embryogenesis abundant (LEA) hydroxyproline-rich glycoprotein family [Forsythia ovata]|uniref:Late embryogenesis abundant (LEA) hydroxyproline-rich glycoprotein family n=1 Tax=Forsythia ovata TaxID=205694 RepID=A0ABD1W3M3_9LAMI
MAEKKEQVKPLAPAAHRIKIDEDEDISMEFRNNHHRKCLTCCGCTTAIFLIQVMIILVLVFTVFRVKDPVIKMNNVKIQGLDVLTRTNNLQFEVNLTVEADVSVKNPNVASFKFSNTTTSLYYDGHVIGEARIPAGQARARRTLDMNVSIDVMVDKLLVLPRLRSDLASGVKKSLLNKIHQYVKDHILEPKYACTFILDYGYQHIDFEENKCKLNDIIQMCKQERARQVSTQFDANSATFYPVCKHVVHGLAHHSPFPNVDESKHVKAFETIYRSSCPIS